MLSNPSKSKSKPPVKLPLLSKTPGPCSKFSPNSNPKVLLTEKSDYELELKPKHRILRSMVDVDKSQHSITDVSSLNFSFKRMSAGMKLLGHYKNEEKLIQKVFNNLHNGNDFSFKINDSDRQAKAKYMKSLHNVWAGKRKQKQVKQETSFSEFLQGFFDCIASAELLKLHDMIIPLMTYGVATDSVYVERSLRVVFSAEDLHTSQVTKKIFVERLKDDKITLQIISSLQTFSESLLLNSEEVFPVLYFSFDSFFKVLKTCWREFGSSLVHISKIAHFLSSKNLLQGFAKAVTFCQSLHFEDFFDMASFERLFLKAILVCQLKNIEFGISLEKSEAPMSLKLALYQRRLLISGASLSNHDKNRAALVGAYKFHSKSNSLNENSLKGLREKVEQEENANKLRIKQIIYEAEHEGCDFVDEKGEIKNGIVNTWDVTNVLHSKESSPKNNLAASRKYFEIFKQNEKNSELPPYSRNVKIFRDNFLFEKFQKVTNSAVDADFDN